MSYPIVGELGSISYDDNEAIVEWKIPRFYSLSEASTEYESPRFSFAGKLWHFNLCLQSPERKFIILFIHLATSPCSDDNHDLIFFKFGFKNSVGEIENLFTCKWSFVMKGIGKVGMPRSEFDRRISELIRSDELTVRCIMKQLMEELSGNCSLPPKKFIKLDTLSKNFKDAFDNKECSDAILRVKDREFKAHKVILSARSSVFAAMFQHDMLEKKTGIVTIPDCNPDSFQIFLEYLYSGETALSSGESALHLYSIAEKYDVQELKSFCIEQMAYRLTAENFADIVVWAEEHDETKLLSTAQDFFNKHLTTILDTTQWQNLLKNNFSLANKFLKEMSSKVEVERKSVADSSVPIFINFTLIRYLK